MTTTDINDGKFWTDDLPRCESTGAGEGTYIFSRSNPFVRDSKSQDRSFYCKVDENTYLYAIFSGHNGTAVAELAMQRMAAEILLGQLNGKNSDEEVKEVLRQAFLSVEKCYQESVETLIAKRTALQCQIMENCISKETVQKSIAAIDAELSVGASVALCLIYKTKIFICNVGTCRVLLCKNDENKAPRVVQFSVDHTLWNEDEILRLRQLGLDLQKLRNASLCSTRCIGYYFGKTGYKNCDFFLEAKSEPIIAQPEIVGGIEIDGSFQFLVLISSGTCKALQDLFSADSAKQNKEIIRITAKHFEVHSSLHDIAQSVVNKIVAAHEELNGEKGRYEEYANMTVIIRDFHGSLSKCQQKRPNQVTFNSFVERLPPTEKNILDDSNNVFGIDTAQYSDTDTTTVSSISEQKPNEIFDKNRKIQPYVDFKPFYERVEETKEINSLPPEIEFD